MSKQTRNHARPRAARAGGPPSVPRTGLLAFTIVGLPIAVAVAGATWMTLGAGSTSPAPSAQPQLASTASAPQAGGGAAAATPSASAPSASEGASTGQPVASATGASASQSAPSASEGASTAKAVPAAAMAAPGMAGQQAFVDPATGKLRPAEHDDVAALNAKGNAGVRRLARTAQAANEPQEFPTEGGAMGIAVPDEVMPYTVATKTPDGRVVIEHVTGGKAATKKVQENTKNGGMVQRKGETNDR